MLNRGKELIRIDPNNNKKLQSSTNDGRSWSGRVHAQFEFEDLTDNGGEILATTSKGLHVSKNEGRSWSRR